VPLAKELEAALRLRAFAGGGLLGHDDPAAVEPFVERPEGIEGPPYV